MGIVPSWYGVENTRYRLKIKWGNVIVALAVLGVVAVALVKFF